MNAIHFKYRIIVDIDATADSETADIHSSQVFYETPLLPDCWMEDGKLTVEGSNALLNGLCRGIDHLIRLSRLDHDANDALLLRNTIETLEELFVENFDIERPHALARETTQNGL